MGLNSVSSTSSNKRKFVTILTTSIGDNLSITTTIPLALSFLLHSIQINNSARVRIYQTNAQLLADINRAIGIAPTGNHGLIFECIGNQLINTQFGVVGANKEAIPSINLPILITNKSGVPNSFTVTASFTSLEN